MGVRVLNCSKSLENYYICIKESIAGFSQRVAEKGDLIYILVKSEKETFCGARGVLGEISDYKPWKDSERYNQCFEILDIEYCTPFLINVVKQTEGKYWGAKILQMSKTIKNEDTVKLINHEFNKNKTKELYIFDEYKNNIVQAEELKKTKMSKKKIPKNKLIIGQSYLDENGEKFIYLGMGTVNIYSKYENENYRIQDSKIGLIYIHIYENCKFDYNTFQFFRVCKTPKKLVEKIDNVFNVDLDNLVLEKEYYNCYIGKRKLEFILD
ncbi:UNVERIFIED_ORG: hypothetical protein B2H93_04495 [Clostridium botulinum]